MPLTNIEEQLKKIKEQTAGMFQTIEEEGITTEEGEVLVAPTAGDLKDVGEIPKITYEGMDKETAGAVSGIGAGAVSATELTTKQYEDWQKQQAEMMKALEGAGVETKGRTPWQAMIDIITKKPKVEAEEALKKAKAKFEVPELLSKTQQQSVKVAQLKGDIDKLDIERLNELQLLEQRMIGTGATMRFLTGEKGEMNRQYDIKKAYMAANLGAEATLLQAYSGNLDLARDMANDVVQAYTFDITQKRQDFDTLFNVYGDWINSLDTEQKDILNNARQDAIREEQNTKVEKAQIMNWLIEYPNAGIRVTDTIEEAAEKARKAEAIKPEEVEETAYMKLFKEAQTAGYVGSFLDFLAERDVLGEPPIEWSDEKIRAEVRASINEETLYEEALSLIELIPSLLNKDRAKFIAAEMYGQVEPGITFEEFIGKAPPAKVITELSLEQKEAVRAGKLIIDPKTGRIATPESLIKKEPETPEGFLLGAPEYTTPLYFK